MKANLHYEKTDMPLAAAPMTVARRRPRVLCVDNDPVMLDIITRMIDRDYEVLGAASGKEALRLIESSAPIDVVVSDLRMHGLSGAQFLQLVRKTQPLTVRILLTAETDLAEAVAAMNQAGLFRLLPKPATRAVLLDTLAAAVLQHQLQIAERELLQETLMGAVRTLAEILAIASPLAFGRASRIRELSLAVAKQMNMVERWPLELASLASQLGHIVLPESTLRLLYAGQKLSSRESEQVLSSEQLAERMFGRIPRLGAVLEILAGVANEGDSPGGSPQSTAAKILKAVIAYETLERTSESISIALQGVRAQADRMDPEVLRALTNTLQVDLRVDAALDVPISDLREDMVLGEDFWTTQGTLLVSSGFRVSESLLAKIANFDASVLPKFVTIRSVS
jgi:response regulator RpfG family c-di-GMP phosphodiesterase